VDDEWLTNTMMGRGEESEEDEEENEDGEENDDEETQVARGLSNFSVAAGSVRFEGLSALPGKKKGGKKRAGRSPTRSGDGSGQSGGAEHVRFGSDEAAGSGFASGAAEGMVEDWEDDDDGDDDGDGGPDRSDAALGFSGEAAQVSGAEVALLLRLFARFLHGHDANRREMVRVGGVPLLAWALKRAADRGALRRCNDREARTLHEKRANVKSGCPECYPLCLLSTNQEVQANMPFFLF
jgi:hypothetical protein